MRTNRVKELLKANQPAVGTWLTLGNVAASRLLARSGLDWLCVDTEHSHVGMETTVHMLGAIADAACVPLARVPSNRHDHIKRMLDNGAYGVVVPMVNTRQEALNAVSACRYPPTGTRSVGGAMHAINFAATPTEYYARADEEIAVILQCEHIEAVRNFDHVYGVAGVDAIFVGPNDLAASMRDAQGKPPSPEEFEEALTDILNGCHRLGLPAGLHTFTLADAKKRIAQGWRFVAVNSDLSFMTQGAAAVVEAVGKAGGEVAKY